MSEANKDLIQALKKIPLFEGLSPSQVKKVLHLCVSRLYEPYDKLCVHGLASDELYILIEGKLDIITEDDKRVAEITPVTTIGELGVITSQPRTATVEATIPSKVLVLKRSHLELLLREEPEIKAKTYQNVIGILSHKRNFSINWGNRYTPPLPDSILEYPVFSIAMEIHEKRGGPVAVYGACAC